MYTYLSINTFANAKILTFVYVNIIKNDKTNTYIVKNCSYMSYFIKRLI